MDSFDASRITVYRRWVAEQVKVGDTREFPVSLHSLYHLREEPKFEAIWKNFAVYLADRRIQGTL